MAAPARKLMALHKTTPPTMPITVTDKGNARTEAALKRLQQAMAEIEADIVANQGIYPFNHGRVTQSELCRRADVKKATLQNPLHKDSTRVDILAWLDGLSAQLAHSRDASRERVTAVADSLKDEITRLRQDNERLRQQLLTTTAPLPAAATALGQIVPGAQFRHYKGGRYTVIGTCLIEATLQPGVLYRPCQGDQQEVLWMRPVADFLAQVATTQGSVPRFAPVD